MISIAIFTFERIERVGYLVELYRYGLHLCPLCLSTFSVPDSHYRGT